MSDISRVFTALSDPTRLRIVEYLLDNGEAVAGELAGLSTSSLPAVSRHLKVLREAGVVARRADGTHRIYSARPQAIRDIADWSAKHRAFWEGGFDRLEALLAQEDEETA